MPFSTFLDGQEPHQLRGLMWLSLTETGYVLRGTATSDSGGGGTVVWGTAGPYECRIDPLREGTGEDLAAAQIDDRSTHLVTLPPGVSVASADRFAITGRGTFEITATRQRSREWAREIEVVAAD